MTPGSHIQRFEILEVSGAGGMATVYRARDPQLERDVALKVLGAPATVPDELSWVRTLDLREAPRSNDALLAEARVMARLTHPNVLAVYEVGLHEGVVFLVMEHVDGRDLRRWLASRPDPAEIQRAFCEAGKGLAAAHARGIVHRDFKPENVLVGSDGRVRVADFGLSALTRGPRLVRTNDQAGTPEYMAPEVLRGEPATAQSDVWAFALALGEAMLGEVEPVGRDAVLARLAGPRFTPRLRKALRAALDDAPARRPALLEVVAALAGTPSRRSRLTAIAATVAILAGGGIAIGVATRGDAVCELPSAVFGGRWDAARRARLEIMLHDDTHDIANTLDVQLASIDEAQRQACDLAARGELTSGQAKLRRSCLERRVLELDGALARYERVAGPVAPASVADALYSVANVRACETIRAPASTAGHAAVQALYERLWMTTVLENEPKITALRELERDAAQAGEQELELVAMLWRAYALWYVDQHAAADATFRDVHQRSDALGAPELVSRALVERSALAAYLRDAPGASASIAQALDLVARPEVSPLTRAYIYIGAARVSRTRGEAAKALAYIEQARGELAATGRSPPKVEGTIRLEHLLILRQSGGSNRETLALARDNLAYVRRIGTRDVSLVAALDNVAVELSNNQEPAAGIAMRREALATAVRLWGDKHSRAYDERTGLADDLVKAGQFAEGREILLSLLAAANTQPHVAAQLPQLLETLANTEYNLGNPGEGMRVLRRAIDESTSRAGADHPDTMARLIMYVEGAIDLGLLDEAAFAVERLQRGYKQLGARKGQAWFNIQRHSSELAIAQGKAREGERVARVALAELAELGQPRGRSAAFIASALARSLVAQGRWREALAAATEGLDAATAAKLREDDRAAIEIPWVTAALALGKRGEARTRAKAAAVVLARWPGQVRANREIAALVRKAR